MHSEASHDPERGKPSSAPVVGLLGLAARVCIWFTGSKSKGMAPKPHSPKKSRDDPSLLDRRLSLASKRLSYENFTIEHELLCAPIHSERDDAFHD
jgi:hypothetical protein